MGTKISALTVGTATSSTPFAAVVDSTTKQVTLEPVYGALSTIQTTLGTLQSTITSVAGSVTTLSGTVTTLSGTVSTMQTDITSLRSTVTDIASALSTTQADVDGLQIGVGPRVPLSQSTWAWVSQGILTVTEANNLVHLQTTAGGTPVTSRGRITAVPASTPYTITAGIQTANVCLAGGAEAATFGIGFVELGSSKQKQLSVRAVGNARPDVSVEQWTASTTFSTVQLSLATQFTGPTVWLRLTDDGTNHVFSLSPDGFNFFQAYSEARGSHFSTSGQASHVGFFMRADSTRTGMGGTVVSWVTS